MLTGFQFRLMQLSGNR